MRHPYAAGEPVLRGCCTEEWGTRFLELNKRPRRVARSSPQTVIVRFVSRAGVGLTPALASAYRWPVLCPASERAIW